MANPLDARHAGESDIEDNGVRGGFIHRERGFARGKNGGLTDAGTFDDLGKGGAEEIVVLNDPDGGR